MNKITVIHHSADFDGLFCREIARKFLPDAELIGWDFGNAKIPVPLEGMIYILDLSPDCLDAPYGELLPSILERTVWIDHHKSSIEKWPDSIPGYRIDGVAACRLAWQWFTMVDGNTSFGWDKAPDGIRRAGVLPMVQDYKNREVNEPLAVRLAGEYDIWDKRDPRAEVFQFGLRSEELRVSTWETLLSEYGENKVEELLKSGAILQRYQQQADASVVNHRSFLVEFDGLKFLALNTARCNSLTFAAKDVPETGHDALMGFYWNGKAWAVSLYHANHRKDLDLSRIAVNHGGGGHRGACGFQSQYLPWLLPTIRDGKCIPQTLDARKWASDWIETTHRRPEIHTDEGAMIGWFANAIMAGYDEGCRRSKAV